MKVFLLPTQEDVAAFWSERLPGNVLVRDFADEAELEAYRAGMDVIEDELDEISGLVAIDCKVTFSRISCLNPDEEEENEVTLDTPGEAAAYRLGVEDAEGWRAPLVLTPDDPGYEILQRLISGDVALAPKAPARATARA